MNVIRMKRVVPYGKEECTSIGGEDVVGCYFRKGVGYVAEEGDDGIGTLAGGDVEYVGLEVGSGVAVVVVCAGGGCFVHVVNGAGV